MKVTVARQSAAAYTADPRPVELDTVLDGTAWAPEAEKIAADIAAAGAVELHMEANKTVILYAYHERLPHAARAY